MFGAASETELEPGCPLSQLLPGDDQVVVPGRSGFINVCLHSEASRLLHRASAGDFVAAGKCNVHGENGVPGMLLSGR